MRLTGKEHVLLADLKEDKLTVSIFHAHYPLFMRPVELENAVVLSIVTDIQEQRVTPATIVMELEKLINFYRYNMWNGTAGITHLLVNGNMTGLMNCLSLIREQLSIQAMPLVKEPLQLATGQVIPARFNRTIGLALKEV